MPRRHGRSNYEIMSRPTLGAPTSRKSGTSPVRRRMGQSPMSAILAALRERAGQMWQSLADRVSELGSGNGLGGLKQAGASLGRGMTSGPVTLRVSPKWVLGVVAVILLTGVTGVLVSWQMGQRTLLASLDAEQREAVELALKATPDIPGGGDRQTPPLTPQRLDPAPIPPQAHRADPRRAGLNYLVYAFTIPAEADRLSAFLRDRGVDVFLVPVQNGRFVMVIDVTRGFVADELKSDVYRTFENARRQLGKEWQRHNNGGDDLATMMPYKYVGTPAEKAASHNPSPQ